jgi:hypothetical protein
MLISTFSCPYCLRARVSDNNEGFFMVDDGVVVIEHEFRKLMVYDVNAYRNHGMLRPATLEIDLASRSTTSIVFRPFQSRNKRFKGGKMIVQGTFDHRRGVEKIILKASKETYLEMKTLVQQLLEEG